MKSTQGEIEVYLCPEYSNPKQKPQTPIPPTDPLLADILNESNRSLFSPTRAILKCSTNRPMPSTSARRNLTFQQSPEQQNTKMNSSKDPVFTNFQTKSLITDHSSVNNSSSSCSISKSDSNYNNSLNQSHSPSTLNNEFNDILNDPMNYSSINDSGLSIFADSLTNNDTNNSPSNIRLKNELISASDEFGLMGNYGNIGKHTNTFIITINFYY